MGMLSALLAFCEGNPNVVGGFPSQKTSNAHLRCFSLMFALIRFWTDSLMFGELRHHDDHHCNGRLINTDVYIWNWWWNFKNLSTKNICLSDGELMQGFSCKIACHIKLRQSSEFNSAISNKCKLLDSYKIIALSCITDMYPGRVQRHTQYWKNNDQRYTYVWRHRDSCNYYYCI